MAIKPEYQKKILDKIKDPVKRAKVEKNLQSSAQGESGGGSDQKKKSAQVDDFDESFQKAAKLLESAGLVRDPKIRTALELEAYELLSGGPPPNQNLGCSSNSHSGALPAPVFQSGQKQVWDSDFELASVGGQNVPSGQDGQIRAGAQLASPRFNDNGDGTVTDNSTGLIWLKDADVFGEVTWNEARVLATQMEDGWKGLRDGSNKGEWRLPTIKELFSMVDYGQSAPIISPDYPARNTVKSSIYWTSTTMLADPTQAWMMTLGIGPTVFMIKTTPNRMWPVRDGRFTKIPVTGQTQVFGNETRGQDGVDQKGVPWPRPRFKDNGDGTVHDTLTGLVWLRNGNAFGWRNWEEALECCNSLCSGDHDLRDGSVAGQWRLPNVKEIESLVDYGRAGPSMPDSWRTGFAPSSTSPIGSTIQPSSYWTSTSVEGAPSEALFIILGVGPVIFENKEHPFFVLPVRDK